MANLETKFEDLESQLSTQHTAIGNALDSILTAMGAPPPTATVTLGDTLAMMVALNNNLIGMAIANGSFHSALLEKLDILAVNTDTIITNNSLNAQRILAAILATTCACPTDAPLLTPPLDVTPTSLADEAKCRRIQFYLSVFTNWLNKIANYGMSASFVTGDVIGTLLSLAATEAGIVATGAEVGAVAGPPGVVIGAIVGLIAGAIFTFGGSVLLDYATQFAAAPLQSALLNALFNVDNADEGSTAFQGVVNAHFSTIPAGIINALWWASWPNDIYSGTPVVDDSAFDGSICVLNLANNTECTTYASQQTTGPLGVYQAILAEPIYGPNNVFIAGNFEGWEVRILTSPGAELRCDYYTVAGVYNAGVSISSEVGTTHTWPVATAAIGIRTGVNTGHSYTVEICPPA